MDPQVRGLLDFMATANAGRPKMWDLPAAESRLNADKGFAGFNAGAPEIAHIEDRLIPGPGGEIPLKVFIPKGEGPFPLLVYIHGGGYVIGSPETHLKLCSELAAGAGVAVVSVHYRLAPEFRPPAQQDDCVAAIRWAVEHAAEFGADGGRFAVGGDSAGGNLTAGACLRLRDEGGPKARLQLLIYGAFDFDLTLPSYQANGDGYILDMQSINWFMAQYIPDGVPPGTNYVAPMRHDLRDLPPAFLQVGTLDPLLDESLGYAAKLRAAGVPATLQVYEDMPHVFMQLTGFLDTAKRGVADACDALRRALAD